MDTTEYYVYLHLRKSDGTVFYVGKGCGDRAWRSRGRNHYWQNTVKKHGYTVEILFDGLTSDEAFAEEVNVIAELRYMGCRLCNQTNGGDGSSGFIYTLEMRKKMSENNVFRRPEVIAKLSAMRRGVKLKPAHVEKIRLAGIGRVQSAQTIEKRASKLRGRKFSPEHLHRLSVAHIGYRHTDIAKNKMSMARRGKPISESTKEKISISNSKPVRRSDGVVFPSASKAAIAIFEDGKSKSIGQGNITSCCAGKLKTAYGFSWAYLSNET